MYGILNDKFSQIEELLRRFYQGVMCYYGFLLNEISLA